MRSIAIITTSLLICLSALSVEAGSVDRLVKRADKLALSHGFEKSIIKTHGFQIKTYYKITDSLSPVNVYIEGDGRAWVTRRTLSDDPTPKNRLVIELMCLDDAENIIYVARPCQYTGKANNLLWDKKYWSGSRFSNEVIEAMNDSLNAYTERYGFSKVNLIGYSGGGAVALLLAARRNDISSVRTVAGNLDHDAVNKYHNTAPLEDSLNPADIAQKIAHIPQLHFVGKEDKVVPPFIAHDYRDGVQGNSKIAVIEVDGCGHTRGWERKWHELLRVSAE